MIADLQPYAEYKESGLPWLGKVPGHWKTERAKWLFTKMARPVHDGDEVVTCFRDGMVTLRRNRRLRGYTEATVFSGYQGIRKGDLVIHGMDAFAGAIGVSDSDGMGTPVYNVCQPQAGVNAGYYAHMVRQMSRSQWILALAKGIRERSTDFRFEMFGNQRVPLPPPAEQAAIVRFLDWANGRLERAIRAKRKVIALLNEQKQAIIHRAVTRGLDPSVPLKSSGIPWLGDIPAHWEVRRLKSVCRLVTSGSRGWARYYTDAGFVFLRIGNISTTSIDLRLRRISYVTPPSGAEGERTRAIPGDILLSITAQIGAVGVVPDGLGEAFVNQHTALIRLRTERSIPRWIAYGLLSQLGKNQCRLMTNGGTKVGLTLEDVRCLNVLQPPLHEQASLVAGIETDARALDNAISRLEREIDLLREYRTRLVADVVTGKLDVREAAARLPEESAVEPSEDDAELDDEPETEEPVA